MTIRANCKINIGLDVLERREDGFHELSTVMYPVLGLYDNVTIEKIEGSDVEFCSEGMVIDCHPDSNLCVRAFRLMQERYHIGAVRITLDKRVPFGAGLGGGSSDATAVIMGINTLFDLNIEEDKLIALAAELGSDTAFFVRNTPQLCSGRGEIMEPIDINLAGKTLILIKPEESVSTREAYSGVKPAYPQKSLKEFVCLPVEEWSNSVKNDFEPHIFEAHPLLAQIKTDLIAAGAIYAAMSGSGSTIYGIFDKNINHELLSQYSSYSYNFEL